jgi:hypothetical protein
MNFVDVMFAAVGVLLGFGLCWMWLGAKISALSARLEDMESIKSERTEYHERAVTAEANLAALEQRLRERDEQQTLQFKDTATQIFDAMSKKSEKQKNPIQNISKQINGVAHVKVNQ